MAPSSTSTLRPACALCPARDHTTAECPHNPVLGRLRELLLYIEQRASGQAQRAPAEAGPSVLAEPQLRCAVTFAVCNEIAAALGIQVRPAAAPAPAPAAGEAASAVQPAGCFICSESGHLADQCPRAALLQAEADALVRAAHKRGVDLAVLVRIVQAGWTRARPQPQETDPPAGSAVPPPGGTWSDCP